MDISLDMSPNSSLTDLPGASALTQETNSDYSTYGPYSIAVEDSLDRKIPARYQSSFDNSVNEGASSISDMSVCTAFPYDNRGRQDELKCRMASTTLEGSAIADPQVIEAFNAALATSSPDESHVDAIIQSFGNLTFKDAGVQSLCRRVVAASIRPGEGYNPEQITQLRQEYQQALDDAKAAYAARELEEMGTGIDYFTGLLNYATGVVAAGLTEEQEAIDKAQAALKSFNESAYGQRDFIRGEAIKHCSGVFAFLRGLGDIDTEMDATDLGYACRKLALAYSDDSPENAEKILLIQALLQQVYGEEDVCSSCSTTGGALFNALNYRNAGKWKLDRNNWRDNPLLSFCLAVRDGSTLAQLKDWFKHEHDQRFDDPYEA